MLRSQTSITHAAPRVNHQNRCRDAIAQFSAILTPIAARDMLSHDRVGIHCTNR